MTTLLQSAGAAAADRVRSEPTVPITVAGEALGISPATASRLAARGEFPVPLVRVGSRWVVPTPALRELLQLDG